MCGSRISRHCGFCIALPTSDLASFPRWSVTYVPAPSISSSAPATEMPILSPRETVAPDTRSTRAFSPSASQSGSVAREHLRFVAEQPCLVCGRSPSHAHHIRYAQPRGLGLKVSDEFTVPLCAIHHSENHTTGNERQWWQEHNLDPLPVAHRLWQKSRSADLTPNAATTIESDEKKPISG